MVDVPDATSLGQRHRITNGHLYKVVLDRCVNQIVHASKTTDKSYTIFTVPSFLIGVTLYKVPDCILYIIQHLSSKNYKVSYIEPCYIHIDWGKRIQFDKNSEYIKEIIKKNPGTRIEFVYETD